MLLKGTLFELYVLSRNRGKVSILVFERSGLQAYLNKAPNAKFLKQMGYCSNELDKVLLESRNLREMLAKRQSIS